MAICLRNPQLVSYQFAPPVNPNPDGQEKVRVLDAVMELFTVSASVWFAATPIRESDRVSDRFDASIPSPAAFDSCTLGGHPPICGHAENTHDKTKVKTNPKRSACIETLRTRFPGRKNFMENPKGRES